MFIFKEELLSLARLFEDDEGIIMDVSNKFIDKVTGKTVTSESEDSITYINAIREVMDDYPEYQKRLTILNECNRIERFIIANS